MVLWVTFFIKNLTETTFRTENLHLEYFAKRIQVRMEFTPAYYSEYTKLLRNHKKLGGGGKGLTRD